MLTGMPWCTTSSMSVKNVQISYNYAVYKYMLVPLCTEDRRSHDISYMVLLVLVGA